MLLNYNIHNKKLETIDFNNVKVINTINPHSYCVANKDLDSYSINQGNPAKKIRNRVIEA